MEALPPRGHRLRRLLPALALLVVLAGDAGAAAPGDPGGTPGVPPTVVAEIADLVRQAQHEPGVRGRVHPEIEARIERWLPVAEAHGQVFVAARLLQQRYLLRMQQNRLGETEALLERALALVAGHGQGGSLRASLRSDLAYAHVIAGDFQHALPLLRRNVVYYTERGDRESLAIEAYILGDAYLKLGELAVARRYFRQSRDAFAAERGRDYFDAVNKLGTIDRLQGRLDAALAQHRAAHAFYAGLGEYRALPTALQVAEDLLALGDRDGASRRARQVFEDDRAFVEQRLDASLVLLEASLGEPAAGRRLIRRIDALLNAAFESNGSPFAHPLRQLRFQATAIRHLLRTGGSGALDARIDRALAVYDHIRCGARDSGSDQLAWASRVEPYVSTIVAALYRTDRTRIPAILEQVYSASMTQAARRLAEPATPAAVARLDAYLSAEQALVAVRTAAAGADAAGREERLGRARAARDRARERYLASRGPAGPQAPSPTAAEPPAVPTADRLLRYYVRDEISFVLVMGPGSERYFDLPSRAVVAGLVAQLPRGGGPIPARLLRDLAVLLPGAALEGAPRRLVIVPDEVIHRVPFPALDLSSPGEPYAPLATRFEVLRTFSPAGYYARTDPRGGAGAGRGELVVFADPAFAPDAPDRRAPEAYRSWNGTLPRLRETAREAASIKALYPDRPVTLYLGAAATSEVLLAEATRAADVLHIATHGYYDEETPDIVGIATAGHARDGPVADGFLSLTELLRHRFDNALVVISGCETLLGRRYEGVGEASLAHGLIARGVGAVIGTLWKIPDRPTALFMREFHAALRDRGGDASAALAATRRVFAMHPRYGRPRYWAAFDLVSAHHAIDRRVFAEPRPVAAHP